MRYLLCLIFVTASTFAQPVEGPWTLLSWDESPGMSTLKVVGNDTVDVFWDTNNSPEGTFIYHAVCVLGEDSFLIEPQRIPDITTQARLWDAILMDNGEWICAIATSGNGPQLSLVRGRRDAVLSYNVIYQGEWVEPCWGTCSLFMYPTLSRMPDGKLLVAGAVWRYYEIRGGVREVDGEPYVFVVNPTDVSVDWEVSSGLELFGEIIPSAVGGDTVQMVIANHLDNNSSLIQLYEGFDEWD